VTEGLRIKKDGIRSREVGARLLVMLWFLLCALSSPTLAQDEKAPTSPTPTDKTTTNKTSTKGSDPLSTSKGGTKETVGRHAGSTRAGAAPSVRTVSLKGGGSVTLRPDGSIRSIDRNGMHIEYDLHGGRRIRSIQDGALVVTTGAGSGFVQHNFAKHAGHIYVERTYLAGTRTYDRFYSADSYRGGVYYRYVRNDDPALTDLLQQQSAQSGGGDAVPTSAAAQGPPQALDPAQRTFVVDSDVAAVANGQKCALTAGDVLTRLTDTPDADQTVTASVAASKKSDCAAGQTVAVSVDDLQEMYNHFQEQLTEGMGELAKKQGASGVSEEPDASAVAPAADTTAAKTLQDQQRAADASEALREQQAIADRIEAEVRRELFGAAATPREKR
jgi:hypothetical protein